MAEGGDESEYLTCKIVLLGEAGVGKTSIITRYTANTFSDVLMSTTGASFATKKIAINEENKVKLQLWDTAGQEKFRSLAKIFYQNAQAAIFVYDITRRDSFENLKSFWIKELKNNATNDLILALVGNKSDNYEFETVTIQEGKDLAKEINAIYRNTSARLSHGIDELFLTIAKKFVDPKFIEMSMNREEESEYRKKLIKENTKKKLDEKDKANCC